MKKITITIAIAAALIATAYKPQENSIGLSRVQKIDGIEIYLMSEPLRSYDVVSELQVNDFGVSEMYIDDWAAKYAKKARKLIEDGKTIDAVVYTKGNKANAVKFK